MFQNSKFKIQNSSDGFSLVEGIIGIAIFLIIFLALSSIFSVVFSTIRNNKARVSANSIALEQLEIIRGMDFDDVKTDTGWSPAGPISSERTLNKSGISFTVQVDIAFVDDPYDGTDGAGDTFPYDYKKARARVLWTNPIDGGTETVAMSTNIVPLGREGLSDGKGGILVIVFDASGQPVFEAVVDITNTAKSYSSLGNLTDLNGNLWIPDLDPSAVSPEGNYHIAVAKTGYNSDQTHAVDNDPDSPTYNPNPTKPDSIVVETEITKVGFAIDLAGNIDVRVLSYNNPQNQQINETDINSQTRVALDIDSGDNIVLAWIDNRQGGSGDVERIYAQKYKYNTITNQFDKQWANDIDLTNSNNREDPRVVTFGTNYFYVSWNNLTAGNNEIYLEKRNSSNGSLVWNVKANETSTEDQIKSDIAVDSAGNVYVVWMDDRNGNWDIYAQKRSTVDGSNLWTADLKVNDDSGSASQTNPRIAVDDSDNAYFIWEDERNTDKDVYWMKYDSAEPVPNKLTGVGEFEASNKKANNDSSGLDQYEPSIVFDGVEYFYMSWSDKRNSQPDIYAQKYDKNGVVSTSGNWASGDVKINDDSLSDAWREKSAVAYSSFDNMIYFSWEDDRNGNPDVYSTKLDTNGDKIWCENGACYDLAINGNSNAIQSYPDVVADSAGYAISVWEDERNGDYDIYAARYKDYKNITGYIRANVPIIVHGAKLKGTYPTDNPIYKLTDTPTSGGKVFTSNGSGDISISAIEWDNYEFIGSGGYTIISTDQPTPLVISPGDTKSIIINVDP